MKSDFDMIVKRFDRPIKIYPISDVHYGALEHNAKAWLDFCGLVTKDPDAYVILCGDLINNNTRSAVGSPFDDTCRPSEQKRQMVEMLEPIKDRVLCSVSGNHERRSLKDADDDPTYDIMSKLDLEDIYRPNAAFMKIQIGNIPSNDKRKRAANTYFFAVTHGAGGGIYTGATVNRNERWGNVIDGVDCIIVGHTHKGTVSRPSKIVLNGQSNLVTLKDYLVISCVAWQNYGGYSLQKMLLPSAVASPQVLHLSDVPNFKNIEIRW